MAIIYVSNVTGDDGNTGTSSDPFASITAAAAAVGTNDDIYIDGSGSAYAEGDIDFGTRNAKLVGTDASWNIGGARPIIDATGYTYGITSAGTGFPTVMSLNSVEVKNATSHGLAMLQTGGYPCFVLESAKIHDNGGCGLWCLRALNMMRLFRSEIHDNGSHGLACDPATGNWTGGAVVLCRIYNNGGDGINLEDNSAAFLLVLGCAIYDNTGKGVTGGTFIVDTIIHGNGSDGVDFHQVGGSWPSQFYHLAWGSAFTNNGGYGIARGVNRYLSFNCGFNINTSGDTENTPPVEINKQTGDPSYANAAAGDFTIGNAAWNNLEIADILTLWGDVGLGREDPAGGGGGPVAWFG